MDHIFGNAPIMARIITQMDNASTWQEISWYVIDFAAFRAFYLNYVTDPIRRYIISSLIHFTGDY